MEEMTSEVQNILNGSVNATHDFQQKKVIGVSTNNLIPGPSGIEPLAKQGAFKQPETIDFAQAMTDATPAEADPIEETLDLPVIDEDDNKGLKIPVIPEIISEEKVQTVNPNFLDSFQMPQIPGESVEPVVEEKDDYKPAIDIQMPEMPDTILGSEPVEPQEELFEKTEEEKDSHSDFSIPILENNNEPDLKEQVEETKSDIQEQIPSVPTEMESVIGEEVNSEKNVEEEKFELPIAMNESISEKSEETIEKNDDLIENLHKELDAYAQINKKIINDLFQSLITTYEELKKANEKQIQLSKELERIAGRQQTQNNSNFPDYLVGVNSQESDYKLQR